MKGVNKLILGLVLLAGCAGGPGAGRLSPQAPWSQRMAETIIQRNPTYVTLEPSAASWSYSTSFLVCAIARVGVETGQDRYIHYSREYFPRFIDHTGQITTPSYDPEKYKLDDIAPGRLLLLLNRRTGEARYLTAAQTLVRQLETQPRTADGGFWHKQIYPHQMWLDGIYMACPFMAEYAQISGDAQWYDQACHQIITIAGHTYDPKSGLFYHGWDESRTMYWADPKSGLSANFWGRAMGWFMLGIVDMLDYLPEDHPKRAQVIEILRQAAEGVARYQDARTGLWYQVLDQSGREGNYLESSASCMFVYALAKGARMGYLDAGFAEVAKRGYKGVLARFIEIDLKTGFLTLTDTCAVAGLGGPRRRDGSYEYYLSEPRVSNDTKGLAPFILASLEMERR